MKLIRISGLLVLFASAFILSGCSDELVNLQNENNTQKEQINQLTSELGASQLKLDQMQRELDAATGKGGVELDVLRQKVAAMEKEIADKNALISSMQSQLLGGGVELPVELSTMLEDFAKDQNMVSFDPNRGLVKFKSDLLFESGSDIIAPAAINVVQSLCGILNSDEARKFDIVIVGHTDDMRIAKTDTLVKHPTNWHLSAHRAIAVLDLMARNGIDQTRMSERGFGEFRPLEANEPGKKGNPKNRRVEIYIVPKGM